MVSIIEEATKAWGLPPIDEKSPFVDQHYQDTCAIRSQQLILNDFGIDVTQEELIKIATENGWYACGTALPDINKLLEYFDVKTNMVENANVYALTNELAMGHRIIVAVDSGELWNPGFGESLEDKVAQMADHALIVAGIDTTDPKNVTVQLMDPGTGDIAKSYPLDQFMDSWKDSNCLMVSTMEPAPPYAFGMNNFDYSTLHLPFVGSMPYAEFDLFTHQDGFDQWVPSGIDNLYSNEMPELTEDVSQDVRNEIASVGWKDWSQSELHNISFRDGLLSCIKGEITISEMLHGVFGDKAPSDIPFSHFASDELHVQMEDHRPTTLSFDNYIGWNDYHQDMANMYLEAGDDQNAEWHHNQINFTDFHQHNDISSQ